LSQAELRIAACMANEANMIKVYANGGDIHATTAAHTMDLTLKQFMAQDEETIDQKRFQAKAVNINFLQRGANIEALIHVEFVRLAGYYCW